MTKDPSQTSGEDQEAEGDDSSSAASDPSTSSTSATGNRPELAGKLLLIDTAIGFVEQAFLVVVLFSLIGVGTYQFIASHLFDINSTWPFEALRYLVFFTAMGGAALSAQKGRMISMDFLARKLPAKKQVILRIGIAGFVMFACFLLFKGGMYVRNSAGTEYEVFKPGTALLALPVGAALIGVHYMLQALVDAVYLAAGQLPPREEGPQAH